LTKNLKLNNLLRQTNSNKQQELSQTHKMIKNENNTPGQSLENSEMKCPPLEKKDNSHR